MDFIKNLGTVLATSTGDGLYAKGIVRTVPLHIITEIDVDSIERDATGKIEFAYCVFIVSFAKIHWNTEILGDMYTDHGIENTVNQHLKNLGYTGTVGWSEHGRQEELEADFDMSYTLIDEIWPDLKQRWKRRQARLAKKAIRDALNEPVL